MSVSAFDFFSPPFLKWTTNSFLVISASVNSRKDKSLRVMSQKFVMLFLVSNPPVVSLDVAAKILIGEDQGADQDKNKFKSGSRITTYSPFLKNAACLSPFKWRD